MRWKRIAILVIGGPIIVFAGYVLSVYFFARIPQPADIARVQSVTVVDDNGRFVGRIHTEADRVSVPLSDMPMDLRHAVIATEDRHFYTHHGVRITSIFRAALSNLFGSGRQGGSTITQQYVKNAFVGNERSISRKVKEAILAIKLERMKSKDEILTLYLNTIYMGRGAYGCEAAATVYFARHCKDLTLAQSALLAGMIQSPENYDPTRDPESALGRRNIVLSFMVRDKYITEEQAASVKQTPVQARKRAISGLAPHYLEYVRQFLESKIGPQRLYAGGVRVHATLDEKMQRAAEDAVAAVHRPKNDPEAALVAVDPATGAVRAMVGARNFATRELNLALRLQQPGSTFKPVVLATAVDQGISIQEKFPAPATRTFNTNPPWTVSTYDHRGHGTLTIEQATWESVNTVYAALILKVGASHAAAMGHRLGITSKLNADGTLTLGTSDVTPLELADMYATFAARGVHHTPYIIDKVTDANGKVLYAPTKESDDAVEQNVADTVSYVLQGVIKNGTGRRAAFGRPAAGKTGTTEECRDVWFAGYTPDLAAAVWNGFADNRSMKENGKCPVFGGTFSALIWRQFMQRSLSGVPASQFATPTGIAPTPTTTPSTPTPTPVHSGPVPTPPAPSPSPTVPVPGPKPKPSKSPSRTPTPSP